MLSPCFAWLAGWLALAQDVNTAAALNLHSAANFSKRLGRPHPSNWTHIADNVRLPFDSTRQLHMEFAEWTDAMKAKQADTIMLSYPLGLEMSPAVRKNDLDYYANREQAQCGDAATLLHNFPFPCVGFLTFNRARWIPIKGPQSILCGCVHCRHW